MVEPWKCPGPDELADFVTRSGGFHAGVALMHFPAKNGGKYRGLGVTRSMSSGEVRVCRVFCFLLFPRQACAGLIPFSNMYGSWGGGM